MDQLYVKVNVNNRILSVGYFSNKRTIGIFSYFFYILIHIIFCSQRKHIESDHSRYWWACWTIRSWHSFRVVNYSSYSICTNDFTLLAIFFKRTFNLNFSSNLNQLTNDSMQMAWAGDADRMHIIWKRQTKQ